MTPEQREQLRLRVEAGKQGRELAQTAMELVDWSALPLAARHAFIAELTDTLPKAPEAQPRDPQQEFREASRHALDFGLYTGVPLCEVPLLYLQWLCDSSRRNHEVISLYLKLRAELQIS